MKTCARCSGRTDKTVNGFCLQCYITCRTGPTGPDVWPLVIAEMMNRDAKGMREYGTPLTPHNGRDALWDCFEEALDMAVYLRQAIFERDGK